MSSIKNSKNTAQIFSINCRKPTKNLQKLARKLHTSNNHN